MEPHSHPDRVRPQEMFERIAGALDPPMYVVTANDGAAPAGCLVGFATQASIEPGRFLVCLSDKNHTFRVALRSRHLAVHLLSPGDLTLARLFGSESGDRIDKFSRCAWTARDHGLPVLDDAPAWFGGPVRATTAFGDHVGFLVEPDAAGQRARPGRFLGMRDVMDLEPGHPA